MTQICIWNLWVCYCKARSVLQSCTKSQCWIVEAVTHGRDKKNNMSKACRRCRLSQNALPLTYVLGVILYVKRSLRLLSWFMMSNEDAVKLMSTGFSCSASAETSAEPTSRYKYLTYSLPLSNRQQSPWGWREYFQVIVRWVNKKFDAYKGASPIKSNQVGGGSVCLGLPGSITVNPF